MDIALVTRSTQVDRHAIDLIGGAVAKQIANDLANAWSVQATLTTFALIPVGGSYCPIIVQDDINMDAAGAHWTEDGIPYAVVEATQDLNALSLAISHEAIEMIIDPTGQRMISGPSPIDGQGEVPYIVEACDPVQSAACGYWINQVLVSDFCLPAFYSGGSPGQVLSFQNRLGAPLTLASGGYLSWISGQDLWQASSGSDGVTAKNCGVYDPNQPARLQTDRHGAPLTRAAFKDRPRRRSAFSKAGRERTLQMSKLCALIAG